MKNTKHRLAHNKNKQYLNGVGYVKSKESTRKEILVVVGAFLLAPLVLRGAFDFRTPVVEAEMLSPIAELPVFETEEQVIERVAQTKWEEFEIAVEKVAPMYNYPAKVVLAQGALESARGRSKFAQERNNFLGIGAYDSDPQKAFSFENAEQCVVEYMRLVKKNFPEAWENRDNPEKLLHALKKNSKGNMYATDPHYVTKVTSMKEWNY